MTEDCCISLQELKKKYEKLRTKYNLPKFEEINKDFEIEKLQERETELLSTEIRRAMIEKNIAYLEFTERFMNPTTAPMFFFALIKNMSSEEKKLVEKLYLELGKFEITSIGLDNEYDEKKDAEFIKSFYKEWQGIKKKFGKIIKGIEEAWDKKTEKKDRDYLG